MTFINHFYVYLWNLDWGPARMAGARQARAASPTGSDGCQYRRPRA